ncbi:MAG: tRNA (adenosine(37)-N6)-threonylcarbamoyltransferase complex transferase subunit TsaD [Candidatus Portnoybacteria bacterium]|nr:tRNA (adenosine(37)-N6)-threonylcarbamoyltransferase complex transferase subunit TsaD [Candidatus Portnoybacteria bacterium]
MIILGIETSCDDTGIAIIKATPKKTGVDFNILSNIVSSQIKIHKKYGGVVPNLAAREHLKNIKPCLKKALKESKKQPKDIDLIGATRGPGLIPALLIGTNFAKALAYKWNKKIIGINHIEAHILAALIEGKKIRFPAIALVVSGGHTQIVLMKKIGDYKIIGETRDDAAGECFDKIAKLLNLGYPGGPIISKKAEEAKTNKYKIQLPRPMIKHKNYDFSFSGLKTAVLYLTQKNKENIKKENFIKELSKEAQEAMVDVLTQKTIKAVKEYKAKTLILSGGVAANKRLRESLKNKLEKESSKTKFFVPPISLCTDNAAMIAATAYLKYKSNKNTSWKKIQADANLKLS